MPGKCPYLNREGATKRARSCFEKGRGIDPKDTPSCAADVSTYVSFLEHETFRNRVAFTLKLKRIYLNVKFDCY